MGSKFARSGALLALLALAATNQAGAQSPLLKEIENSFVRLHEDVGPCVVNIESQGRVEPGADGERMEDLFHFFGVPMPQPGEPGAPDENLPAPRSTGSGFIYDKQGYIVTNNHVIEDADRITVRLYNGNEYPATVVGADPESDIAVIKIDSPEDLPVAILGDSDKLQVGQFAIAIGSPRGFEGSVSFGHVSALGRDGLQGLSQQGLTFQNLIQTDAAINLGNSGGPLCNIQGEVVGINTAIVWGANSIGFAIPINTAKRSIPELIAEGKVTRGFLGVTIRDAREFADALSLPDNDGAIVIEVHPETPASLAGLEHDDVIRKVNGTDVKGDSDLMNQISAYAPGESVLLQVWRRDEHGDKFETLEIKVTLQERPQQAAQAIVQEPILGMRYSALTPERLERFGLPPEIQGVMITAVEPESPAGVAGIEAGDIITEVAQNPVTDGESFRATVEENSAPGKPLLVRYMRGGNGTDITVIRIPKDK
ncbi:MAG: trypsin-like peptidase domain-containing protein [Candidatus Hydrogenedentes bacterium]|nr:trypsin-like peptidase domain-containing protein [Candidatus Hydrogenedentota bacterium]